MEITFIEPKKVSLLELQPNDYNPNKMPKLEMQLLKDCIRTYGFLFPIVVVRDGDKYRIVDGYHRYQALIDLKSPVAWIVELDIPLAQAMQLTVLMNRIKGMHQVERMSELVVNLSALGMTDAAIAKNLGMEAEEFIRLKQQLGIAAFYSQHQYSNSWEIE